jgi:hypothetical protein
MAQADDGDQVTTRVRLHSPPKLEDKVKDVPDNIMVLLIVVFICAAAVASIYIGFNHL